MKLPGFGSFTRTDAQGRHRAQPADRCGHPDRGIQGHEVHGRRRLQVRRELRSLATTKPVRTSSDRETSPRKVVTVPPAKKSTRKAAKRKAPAKRKAARRPPRSARPRSARLRPSARRPSARLRPSARPREAEGREAQGSGEAQGDQAQGDQAKAAKRKAPAKRKAAKRKAPRSGRPRSARLRRSGRPRSARLRPSGARLRSGAESTSRSRLAEHRSRGGLRASPNRVRSRRRPRGRRGGGTPRRARRRSSPTSAASARACVRDARPRTRRCPSASAVRHRWPSSSAIGCGARAARSPSSAPPLVDALQVVRFVRLEQQQVVGAVVRAAEAGEEVRVTGRDDPVDGQPAGVAVVGMEPVALPRVVAEHERRPHLSGSPRTRGPARSRPLSSSPSTRPRKCTVGGAEDRGRGPGLDLAHARSARRGRPPRPSCPSTRR